jgi:hypothetical protein
MDTKKLVLTIGAAALLVMGVIVVAGSADLGAAGFAGKRGMGFARHGAGNMSSILGELGLPAGATREQIDDARWERQIKDLGLTDASTLGEYRQALKAKMAANAAQRMQGVRTKLGLGANATDEEVRAAMGQWRQTNKDLLEGGEGPMGCAMGRGMRQFEPQTP